LRIIAGVSIFIIFILAVLMATILVRDIFSPIRRLIAAVNRDENLKTSENVVKALSRGVYHLMENMDVTQSELDRSRETLVQSEKMAMVGKLAAGMAHSIRNPFTSVKMRLFSLGRSLELNMQQKEDFDVISDEIRHVDAIVQNFLEFSRPPRLKMQRISPSAVTDTTIRLLKHRLKSYSVEIKVIRTQPLPDIQADPEQLKEVFVNIIINACEAMQDGGTIVIHEEVTSVPQLNKVAVIRLSDNGPGISDSIQTKIFEHFFTTKEEGTGLGLSIAKRIIEEHKGWLDMRSEKNAGTTFIITLPLKE
jgi:signal transduction histidine kinase